MVWIGKASLAGLVGGMVGRRRCKICSSAFGIVLAGFGKWHRTGIAVALDENLCQNIGGCSILTCLVTRKE